MNSQNPHHVAGGYYAPHGGATYSHAAYPQQPQRAPQYAPQQYAPQQPLIIMQQQQQQQMQAQYWRQGLGGWHVFHGIMTLFTGGLWAIIWVLHAIARR